MDELIIEPGIGIGKLKLGMNKSEVDEVIQYYVNEYEKGTSYFNFFENAFKVEYDSSGKVKFIEIVSEFKNFFNCTCHNLDVFNTKANELVQNLNRISEYEEETNGETQYIFTNIGLSLWRSSVFTEETMQEDWFKEMCTENQEEEMRYFYFQTVAVYPNDGLYYKGLI
ncbi:hypothetical protein P5G61_05830 [Paenibacillus sp. F6_3S_P_1C]|uniref:Uncharacterized protein n=1 Tax=Paenibacillus vandeheii TaxID=3035917 RepID=A0ABT8J868_9BACL|nr:hypothetical protein [Paenibacillus vandeheii]MDN4600737.1 hypothetical protein [Paenibacillus vandeheii]